MKFSLKIKTKINFIFFSKLRINFGNWRQISQKRENNIKKATKIIIIDTLKQILKTKF